MRRVPLYQLLALIAVVAIGLAGITSGSDLWGRALFALTLMILLASVLGVILRLPPFGAWLGFALFGCVFFLLTILVHETGGWFNDDPQDFPDLKRLVEQVHHKPTPPPDVDVSLIRFEMMNAYSTPANAAYGQALKAYERALVTSWMIVRLFQCLALALIGSIVGRFLEARRAASG